MPSPPESVDQIVKIYERAMTPKTRLIMVSHMTYVTGLITPIKALADLAHSKGALISVDGAHPLGMLDLDLKATGIDHYAAAGQKWLLAGTGSGVCYVKRDVQDKVWPLMGTPPDRQRPEGRGAGSTSRRPAQRARLHGDGRCDGLPRGDRQEERRGARAVSSVPNCAPA